MEIIPAKALKSSCFISEVAVKPANSQPLGLSEDVLYVSPTSAAADDFSIEEFFDLERLSEDEREEEEELEEDKEEELEEEKSSSSSSSSISSCLSSQDQIDEGSSFSVGFPSAAIADFLSAADVLAIPADDIIMEELELWSHLMDDTLSDDIFACPTRNVHVKPGPGADKRVQCEPDAKEPTRFPPPIPAKQRSKRLRTGSGAWSTCSLLKPDYSPASFEPGFAVEKAVRETKAGRPRKLKRKLGASQDGPVQQRKCSHCQVQKTPQWRTGPQGPKTLCNACGVRFKSGRLFPEYRPACSPTFSSDVHSNSHRKVVEMRKRSMGEPTGPVLPSQF